jgi:hypothetical protein
MEIRHLQFVFKFERCSPVVSPFPSPIRMFCAACSGKPAQSGNGPIVGGYGIDKLKHARRRFVFPRDLSRSGSSIALGNSHATAGDKGGDRFNNAKI